VALSFCNISQSYRGVKIRQTTLGVRAMAGKKIKLDKEAITDMLVAETDSESGAEASDVEDYFEEEEEEEEKEEKKKNNNNSSNNNNNYNNNNNSKPQKQSNHRLQQEADYPTWGLPQGRNTNIHPFVGPAKSVKNG
jgi:hypothetical protein